MQRSGLSLLIAILIVLSGPAAAQRTAGFQVVVNAANPVSQLSRDELSSLFLKKSTRWEDGSAIHPVDLPNDSPIREVFSRQIHGRSVASIAAYWQQQIFSGRGVPPPEKNTEAEAAAFVRADPGAIGYLSAGAVPPGLKTVQVSP